MPKFIIRDFIKQFSILDSIKANIQIKHKLYGEQKMNRCVVRPFVDEERIGIIMDDGEKKYVSMDELCEAGIDENRCYLKSDVMELDINFIF